MFISPTGSINLSNSKLYTHTLRLNNTTIDLREPQRFKICTCSTHEMLMGCENECMCLLLYIILSPMVCFRTPDSEPCSGRGDCLYGMCDCHPIMHGDPSKRYSGQFCDCDDYSCDYYDNQLCGGPERGVCSCGRCTCHRGHSGSACQCPTGTDGCLASNGVSINDWPIQW